MKSKLIELKEYEPDYFGKDLINMKTAKLICDLYSNQIKVEFPSRNTDGRWKLESRGWVGLIRLNNEVTINITSKVNISSLFSMWEYAYKLKSFHILDGLVQCQGIEEYYNQLAAILTDKIYERSRKGLYKTYENRMEYLPYIKGRLDINDMVKRPPDAKVLCEYQENTVDNIENQILLWTLHVILKSGNLNEHNQSFVRKTYMTLYNAIELIPYHYMACLNRNYNRLNEDYKLLHSLCHFFLANTGPSHQLGDKAIMPFIVNMGQLFEMFVAQWLNQHLPSQLGLITHEKIVVDDVHKVGFDIDIVIYDKTLDKVICVIDTKYKKPDSLDKNDIHQIIAYAELKACNLGILLYPERFEKYSKIQVNTKTVIPLYFDIQKNIEEGGQEFLKSLLKVIGYENLM